MESLDKATHQEEPIIKRLTQAANNRDWINAEKELKSIDMVKLIQKDMGLPDLYARLEEDDEINKKFKTLITMDLLSRLNNKLDSSNYKAVESKILSLLNEQPLALDIDFQNIEKDTLLIIATRKKYYELCKKIMSLGPKTYLSNKEGDTAYKIISRDKDGSRVYSKFLPLANSMEPPVEKKARLGKHQN